MRLGNMLKICLSFWKSEPQYAYKLQKTCIHENVIAYDIFVKRNLFVYKFKNIQAFWTLWRLRIIDDLLITVANA